MKNFFRYLMWLLKEKPAVNYQGFNCGCCGVWVSENYSIPAYKSYGKWWDTWGLCDVCKGGRTCTKKNLTKEVTIMGYNREYVIKLFFNEIIATSHTSIMMEEAISAGGYPLSGLLNTFLTSRGVSTLIDEMVNDDTGESHEFRLNSAGLKLYWRLDREHDLLKISIGGDQVKDYPRFVAAVRFIISFRKF